MAACAAPVSGEIGPDQAIEIARKHVSFEPDEAVAESAVEAGRPVWRITFRRAPGPIPMGNIMIVTLDRHSGELLSLARG